MKNNRTPDTTENLPGHAREISNLTNQRLMAKSYYEKNKDKILRKLKERYQDDKEFRDKSRETYRERYQTDPEYRAKTQQRARDRYHTDENYKQATLERARKRGRKQRNNL